MLLPVLSTNPFNKHHVTVHAHCAMTYRL